MDCEVTDNPLLIIDLLLRGNTATVEFDSGFLISDSRNYIGQRTTLCISAATDASSPGPPMDDRFAAAERRTGAVRCRGVADSLDRSSVD